MKEKTYNHYVSLGRINKRIKKQLPKEKALKISFEIDKYFVISFQVKKNRRGELCQWKVTDIEQATRLENIKFVLAITIDGVGDC